MFGLFVLPLVEFDAAIFGDWSIKFYDLPLLLIRSLHTGYKNVLRQTAADACSYFVSGDTALVLADASVRKSDFNHVFLLNKPTNVYGSGLTNALSPISLQRYKKNCTCARKTYIYYTIFTILFDYTMCTIANLSYIEICFQSCFLGIFGTYLLNERRYCFIAHQ